jgi:hypothetical protein
MKLFRNARLKFPTLQLDYQQSFAETPFASMNPTRTLLPRASPS